MLPGLRLSSALLNFGSLHPMSLLQRRGDRKKKKRREMKRERQRRVLTETQVGDMKLMEFLNIQKTLALARECVR